MSLGMILAELKEALLRHPRVTLGVRPTPLHAAPRFSSSVGAEVWLKRDDLTGIATGGNKVRKLEFLLAEAEAAEADTLISVGAAQSNHARTVAAVAAMRGLDCHLVLGGERPPAPTGSLVADLLLDARLHFAGSDDWRLLEARADELARDLRRQERSPFVIPLGGSTPVGALGFVAAFVELQEQCAAIGLEPGCIVHATSSGGTQAGLELARQLLGQPAPRICGVAVAKTTRELKSEVTEIMKGTAQALGAEPGVEPPRLLDGFVGPGYAVPTDESLEAISLLARTEGILTDPVYTGKALQAVVELGADGLGPGPVVFWHTGGLPALFSDEQGLTSWSRWPEA